MKKISFKMCDNFKVSLLARNNVYELENNATMLEIDCNVDEALTYKLHVLHKDGKSVLYMDKNEDSVSVMLTDAYFNEKGIYYIQVEGIKEDFRIVSNQIRIEVGSFINAEYIPTPEEQSVIDKLAIKVTALETDVDLLKGEVESFKADLEAEVTARKNGDDTLRSRITVNFQELDRRINKEALDRDIEDQNIKSSIPKRTSNLINDSGYITRSDIPAVPTKTSDLTNDSGFITSRDIPAVPTKTSDLENDSGFITGSVVRTVNHTAPDANGNVNVSGGGGEGTVKSVNNVQPDANGNVTLDIPAPYNDTQVKADIAQNKTDINAIKTNLIAIEETELPQIKADLNELPTDVQINGTSILDENKVAKITANVNTGVGYNQAGLYVSQATPPQISGRSTSNRPITPNNLDNAVKSAMTDGKGAEWTYEEKASARTRIGAGDLKLLATITIGEDVADEDLPSQIVFTADSDGNPLRLNRFEIRAEASIISGSSGKYKLLAKDSMIGGIYAKFSTPVVASLSTINRKFVTGRFDFAYFALPSILSTSNFPNGNISAFNGLSYTPTGTNGDVRCGLEAYDSSNNVTKWARGSKFELWG